MNGIELHNISDFLKTKGFKFSPEDLRIRWNVFRACELLIRAQLMAEAEGYSELNDEIEDFFREICCYQTWNPPGGYWNDDWNEGKTFHAPPQKLDENLNPIDE